MIAALAVHCIGPLMRGRESMKPASSDSGGVDCDPPGSACAHTPRQCPSTTTICQLHSWILA